MKSPFLPWTTRGVKMTSRDYLASMTMNLEDQPGRKIDHPPFGLSPDTYFTDAIPMIQQLRMEHAHEGPGGIEYGCFNHDGTIIEEQGLRVQRQIRNILYYVIRDLFNIRRKWDQHMAGLLLGVADPVPQSPHGQWAVMLTEECPNREEVMQVLAPLVEHRAGKFIEIPRLVPPDFIETWLRPRFNDDVIPPYLLICDTFENIPIEYQFVLNAFAVTGRLWFDEPTELQAYVEKILRIEKDGMEIGLTTSTIASPVDDSVTFADRLNIIDPLLALPAAKEIGLHPLLSADFTEQSLLERAASSRFLALYCHGLGLSREEWDEHPELQGSFVLRFDSKEDEGLLTPSEIVDIPFVPGGIVFSPACMGGEACRIRITAPG